MNIHYKEKPPIQIIVSKHSQDFYRLTYGKVNVLFIKTKFLLVFLREFMFFRIQSSEKKIKKLRKQERV